MVTSEFIVKEAAAPLGLVTDAIETSDMVVAAGSSAAAAAGGTAAAAAGLAVAAAAGCC